MEAPLLPAVAAALKQLQQRLLSWGGDTIAAAASGKGDSDSFSTRTALTAARSALQLSSVEPPSAPIDTPSIPIEGGFISVEEAAALEEKITQLESRLWGDSEDDTGVALGPRVLELQEQVRQADPMVLDTATQQAKLLVAQLKAIPPSTETQGGEGALSDPQLNQALDLMLKWEGVRCVIPAVVRRMESLAELHTSALRFHHRLQAAEASGAQVRRALSENGAVLQALKVSMGGLVSRIEEGLVGEAVHTVATVDASIEQGDDSQGVQSDSSSASASGSDSSKSDSSNET
jgi:hypothetical protein